MANKAMSLMRGGQQGKDRRAEIVNAAALSFMAQGFAATSIDDIARLLGCTKGLIYYHFKTKTELFFAVHWRAMEVNLGNIRPLAKGTGTAVERIRDMVAVHVGAVFERLAFQRVAMMGLEMHKAGSTTAVERAMLDDLLAMHHEYEGLFADVVGEGISSGEFRAGNVRMITKPLLGALNWMVMWYRDDPAPSAETKARVLEEMTTFVIGGLAASN